MIMVIVTMIRVHGLEVTDTFVGGGGGGGTKGAEFSEVFQGFCLRL